jgi:hypothetical protein
MKIINKTEIKLMNDYINKDFVICVAVNLDQNYLLLIDQTVSLIFCSIIMSFIFKMIKKKFLHHLVLSCRISPVQQLSRPIAKSHNISFQTSY